MREADVGREEGRVLGAESALVTLDSGAKIPDNRSKKRRVAIGKNEKRRYEVNPSEVTNYTF